MVSVSVITIGDELLIGHTLDTNAHFISEKLDDAGFSIQLRISVGDSHERICEAFRIAENSSDIILLTGGLGPTRDDITKKALATYFGTTLVLNEEALNDVTEFFGKRGSPLTDINRMQAYLPGNSVMIRNSIGTAPGMWLERNGKVFISMPGVPHEMEQMIVQEVVPKLKERYLTPVIIHKTIMTAGIGESWLSELIRDWENELSSNMKLAYLPGFGQVKLRITATGLERDLLIVEVNGQIEKLDRLAGEYIYGYDNLSLEQKIGEMLREKRMTISLAESCTGGNVAHMITTIPGSSDYFLGGIVAYNNKIKQVQIGVNPHTLEKFGAVSEEAVKEMASGVRQKFESNIALSISGIAGPSGGTEEKPVGLVWMAIENNAGINTRKYVFVKNRLGNIQYASVAALTFLWQSLKQITGIER